MTTNDEIYATGLLTRALDPATQPPAIREFLNAENAWIDQLVRRGMRVIDLGCGTGRHLGLVAPRLVLGVGVDYERGYIAAARHRTVAGPVHFLVADATRVPLDGRFDLALCLNNTWGTVADKQAVLDEMRRLAPAPGSRVLTVYGTSSIAARCEWYPRLGHGIATITETFIETTHGFCSEHFTEERLGHLVGPSTIRPLATVGYRVTF